MKPIALLILTLTLCSCGSNTTQDPTERSTEKEIYNARLKMAARDYGTTPLMRAAESGNLTRVQELVEGGADPDARDDLGATVVSRLSSLVARRPENMQSVAEQMKQIGMSDDLIATMIQSSTPPNLTPEDYERIQRVLEYLKEKGAAHNGFAQ